MKILHVVPLIHASTGGPAVSVTRLASEQVRLGHEVSLVCLEYPGLGPLVEAAGVRVVTVQGGALAVWGRGWSPELRRVVMAEAAKADVVHNHGLWMWPNAYAREGAVAAGKPLVISPRGMLEPWSLKRSRLRKAVAWWLFERKNLRAAALFHATAESEAESIRRSGVSVFRCFGGSVVDLAFRRARVAAVAALQSVSPRSAQCFGRTDARGERQGVRDAMAEIVVAPNGVDLPDVAQRPGREILERGFAGLRGKRWVVFMSRLHPKKGIEILLRAWRGMGTGDGGQGREARGEVVLVLAGADLIGYRRDVERMVRDMGLQDSVVLTGEVQGEMKNALLANAEVFVLPSYSENFGIVVAEALAWGRPVITTTGTPWKEVRDVGAGWWVEAQKEELARALTEALGKGDVELDAMGACGRRLVAERYGWEAAASKLTTAYTHLRAERKTHG